MKDKVKFGSTELEIDSYWISKYRPCYFFCRREYSGFGKQVPDWTGRAGRDSAVEQRRKCDSNT